METRSRSEFGVEVEMDAYGFTESSLIVVHTVINHQEAYTIQIDTVSKTFTKL